MLKKFPDSFEKYKPYRAKLAEGIGHVYGTIPGGTPEARAKGANQKARLG